MTKRAFPACGVVGMVLLTAPALGVAYQPKASPAVYTSAQAARGKVLYQENCGTCHAPDLSGSPMAPTLGRDLFLSKRRSFRELVDYAQFFMPMFSPNGLSRQQTTDILAYVLEVAKFPAGSTELPALPAAQDAIAFDR